MKKTSGTEVLTARQLNRATLERQLLLRRAELPALAAVEHLLGLQAQATTPPYYALAARLQGFERAELSGLIESRQLVRIAAMRSTLHMLSAADTLILQPLGQPALDRELNMFRKHLVGVDLERLAALTRKMCEERAVPMKELGAALQAEWPEADLLALKIAARTLLPLVQAPPRGLWGKGGQVALSTVQSYLGEDVEDEPDLAAIALRYLAAFGPASVKDMQQWCGRTRLREVFERLRPQLITFRDEKGVELFDLPEAPRPDPQTPAPPRFLGEYDNLLLSHADRSRMVAEEVRNRNWERRYAFGIFLVDGFGRGIWRITEANGTATLEAETFSPLKKAERSELEQEGAGVLALTAPDAAHDMRVTNAL